MDLSNTVINIVRYWKKECYHHSLSQFLFDCGPFQFCRLHFWKATYRISFLAPNASSPTAASSTWWTTTGPRPMTTITYGGTPPPEPRHQDHVVQPTANSDEPSITFTNMTTSLVQFKTYRRSTSRPETRSRLNLTNPAINQPLIASQTPPIHY